MTADSTTAADIVKNGHACPLPTVAARLAYHRGEVAALEQQQRDEADARLLRAIVLAIGSCVFDAGDLFARRELRDALAGYTKNTLGRRLMQLTNRDCGSLMVQLVERARGGRVYTIVSRHRDASGAAGDGA